MSEPQSEIMESKKTTIPRQYRQGEFFLLALQSVSALLIVLVTTVYAFFAYSQWQTMKQQGRTLENQATAMRGQISAMQDQLNVMRDQASSMKEGVRPILGIEPIDSDDFEGRAKEITLTFINAGNGAAKEVNMQYGFAVGKTAPSDCGIPNTTSDMIPPHEKFPIRMKVDASLLEQLKNQNTHLFLCGKTSYGGTGERYEIKFCFVWRPDFHAFGSDCSAY